MGQRQRRTCRVFWFMAADMSPLGTILARYMFPSSKTWSSEFELTQDSAPRWIRGRDVMVNASSLSK